MKHWIKQTICLLLASFVILSAAGCSKTYGGALAANAGTAEPRTEATAQAAATLAPQITASPVQVTESPTPDPGGYRLIGDDELREAVARNEYSSEEQKVMVESALSLVGRVSYFWGGKSYAKGFDPDWGEPRVVTSKGDSTTGQTLPYGLDCSGFICWCGAQLGRGVNWTRENIGEGTWHQWESSVEVDADELLPGDIAFLNAYPRAESNHIGIVVGFLENGEPIIAHCSSTENNIVVSTAGGVFNYFRRLAFLTDNVS